MALYWLKRDFRLADNPALTAALAAHEHVVPIFINEPSWRMAPETSAFHVHAVSMALRQLGERITDAGGQLLLCEGEVVDVLTELHRRYPFAALYSHEEVGIERTYARDRAVADWCRQQGVEWTELRQMGVFRRLKDRDSRQREWKRWTDAPLLPIPDSSALQRLHVPTAWTDLAQPWPSCPADWGHALSAAQQQYVQPVSELDAEATLHSFLYDRGKVYASSISSPLSALTHGSRLSVHLAWGTLTVRSAYQHTQQRIADLKASDDPEAKEWGRSLRAFLSRLHWHDHFIQRLETEPEMEFRPLNPAFAQLVYDNDPALFAAWQTGHTGFALVDACIRCLLTTGFINFRMRAMLTSVACHTLHIHWKLLDHPMARMYTDYEPGIHLAQLQMQAGVVGINTLRTYSPHKQLEDQDPDAVFVHQWVPELRPFSGKEIRKAARATLPLGDYPAPLVDWASQVKIMRDRYWAIRKDPTTKLISEQVFDKHGSRKSPASRKKRPQARSSQ